jgi:hypothetical protein
MIRAVQALLRGLLGVFHPKMLLLSVLPFAVAGVVWGFLGMLYWDAWIDLLREVLTQSTFGSLVRWSVSLTGLDLSLILPPLLGMLMLVPLVAATAMFLIAVFGMPLILKHVAARRFARLEAKSGGSWWGSAYNGVMVALLLAFCWIITLPLWLIPAAGPIVPLLLMGWATASLFGYDALADHADAQESRLIRRTHRWELFVMGAALAMLGSVPTLLWIAGALVIPFLPVMALTAVWLYGVVFIASGLAFAHYCLDALQRLRVEQHASQAHNVERTEQEDLKELTDSRKFA